MFERLVKEVRDLNTSAEALKQNFLDLTQLKHILRKTHSFFDEVALIILKFIMVVA